MRPRSDRERDELLLDHLQRTPRFIAVSAHCRLHSFHGGPVSWLNKIHALTSEQETALRRPSAESAATPDFDDADEAMLSILQRDGRAAMSELQAASGLSEDAARRRLEHLRASGVACRSVSRPARDGRAPAGELRRGRHRAGQHLRFHSLVALANSTRSRTWRAEEFPAIPQAQCRTSGPSAAVAGLVSRRCRR